MDENPLKLLKEGGAVGITKSSRGGEFDQSTFICMYGISIC
jgi:hypothetical protein